MYREELFRPCKRNECTGSRKANLFSKIRHLYSPRIAKIFLSEFTNDLHYECELVVKINRLGKYIDTKFAHKYYSHVSLGLDLTARDIQKKCKENGHPWEIAKSFDKSAPISGKWISVKDLSMETLSFELFQNNSLKQNGS